jgi:hypothetical protein
MAHVPQTQTHSSKPFAWHLPSVRPRRCAGSAGRQLLRPSRSRRKSASRFPTPRRSASFVKISAPYRGRRPSCRPRLQSLLPQLASRRPPRLVRRSAATMPARAAAARSTSAAAPCERKGGSTDDPLAAPTETARQRGALQTAPGARKKTPSSLGVFWFKVGASRRFDRTGARATWALVRTSIERQEDACAFVLR